jgi:heptosyltransferase-3
LTYRSFKLKNELSIDFIDKFALYIIKLNYALKNQVISLISKVLFRRFRNEKIRKILVLRMGSMGDTITALPAFTAIRNNFPDAQIDLLTNKFQPGKAYINEILPPEFFKEYFYYTTFVDRGIIKQLRDNQYDLYIELPTYRTSIFFELRSMIVAKRIKSKYGLGWHISSDRFLSKSQEKLLKFDPNRVRLLEILKQYSFKINKTGWKLEDNSVILPEFDTRKILNIHPGKKGIIALVPGAGLPEKKWPLQNFKDIAKHFSDKNYLILLIGGKQDFIECESIANGDKNMANLCGTLSVLENALVLKQCSITISNDTGPMHLSYAAGTPVVALFTTRDYAGKWSPPEDGKNIIIRSENKDIKTISVEDVIHAANQILNIGKGSL